MTDGTPGPWRTLQCVLEGGKKGKRKLTHRHKWGNNYAFASQNTTTEREGKLQKLKNRMPVDLEEGEGEKKKKENIQKRRKGRV